jgi:putative ATP-dependent endonuclease of OLD family
MFLERLDIQGFRNCCESVAFDPTLTLLLGENNAGKSNLIDALRLVLPADTGSDRIRPTLSDFTRDAGGSRSCDEFTLTAVFADMDITAQGMAANALAPSEGPNKARIGIHAWLRDEDDVRIRRFAGDLDWTDAEGYAFSVARHIYLPPLRNAIADLQPGRSNRLARLLQTLASEPSDRQRLLDLAQEATDTLHTDPAVTRAHELVQRTLDAMAPARYHQETDLAFSTLDFPALARRLQAFLGEDLPRDLTESGAGYQNLLYMAVLLAHLQEAEQLPMNVLLIEEPEAHLHPQLQDLLLRFLQGTQQATASHQVIVTSHSPQFASAADLERIVVLHRPPSTPRSTAHAVRDFPMAAEQRRHVRRFLDVTKASLFFARGVILVEGISEQLLLPQLARIIGRDLAASGVSIVNIGGVAFSDFAALFGPDALPIPCSIVSDGDADKCPPDADHPDLTPSPRAKKLLNCRGGQVDVFLADVTLEWDLACAQPRDRLLISTLNELHPTGGSQLASMDDLSPQAWAFQFRNKLSRKAEFAQALASTLDANHASSLKVPDYLRRAIEHVTKVPAANDDGTRDGDEP